MNLLAQLLSSGARAQIFRLLFDGSLQELHLRDIERKSGFSVGSVRQELGKLSKLDIVTKRQDGNRVYYSANNNHPLYNDICSIVIKTIGLVEVLREALDDKRILSAFVFGSIVSGEETARSDVDLVIIGSLGLRDVSQSLSNVESKIGREINPIVLSKEELNNKIKEKDHFLSRVLDGPKLFIIGSQDDLNSMG